jgi:hypothetical protein
VTVPGGTTLVRMTLPSWFLVQDSLRPPGYTCSTTSVTGGVAFTCSRDVTAGPDTIPTGGTETSQRQFTPTGVVGPLPCGQTFEATVVSRADPNNVIAERWESNNDGSISTRAWGGRC